MKTYYISIIIPVYNSQKFISRALQSLVEQSIGFENLEIIAVDDHSTDDSYEILEEYADIYDNIKVLKTSKNSGSASAPRNLGMEKATAHYFMFLDSDDFFEKDALKFLYEKIEETGADLVTGYYREVSEDGAPLEEKNSHCKVEGETTFLLPNDMLKSMDAFMLFWCKIYRSENIQKNKIIFKEKSYLEDAIFQAEYILNSKKIIFIDCLIYNYCQRTNSISHTHSFNYMMVRCGDYWNLFNLFQKFGQLPSFNIDVQNLSNYYTFLIFEENVLSDEEKLLFLEKWQWFVKYSLDAGLFVHDDYQKKIFTQITQMNFSELDTQTKDLLLSSCYLYVAYRNNCWIEEKYNELKLLYQQECQNHMNTAKTYSVLLQEAQNRIDIDAVTIEKQVKVIEKQMKR